MTLFAAPDCESCGLGCQPGRRRPLRYPRRRHRGAVILWGFHRGRHKRYQCRIRSHQGCALSGGCTEGTRVATQLFSAPASKHTVFTVFCYPRWRSHSIGVVSEIWWVETDTPLLRNRGMVRAPAIVWRKLNAVHRRDIFQHESSEVTTTGRAEEGKIKATEPWTPPKR